MSHWAIQNRPNKRRKPVIRQSHLDAVRLYQTLAEIIRHDHRLRQGLPEDRHNQVARPDMMALLRIEVIDCNVRFCVDELPALSNVLEANDPRALFAVMLGF